MNVLNDNSSSASAKVRHHEYDEKRKMNFSLMGAQFDDHGINIIARRMRLEEGKKKNR